MFNYSYIKTYFIKVILVLSPAIISVTNKMQINDISNRIMFGIQHNLRHFQGEVSFTEMINTSCN